MYIMYTNGTTTAMKRKNLLQFNDIAKMLVNNTIIELKIQNLTNS